MRNGTMLSPSSPGKSAEMFNKKRNDTTDLVHALNLEQRSLYQAFRDKSKDQIQFNAAKSPLPSINPGLIKDYTANLESTGFAHETLKTVMKAPRHSVAGMQSIHYDMINAAKPEKGGQVRDLYSPTGKI